MVVLNCFLYYTLIYSTSLAQNDSTVVCVLYSAVQCIVQCSVQYSAVSCTVQCTVYSAVYSTVQLCKVHFKCAVQEPGAVFLCVHEGPERPGAPLASAQVEMYLEQRRPFFSSDYIFILGSSSQILQTISFSSSCLF